MVNSQREVSLNAALDQATAWAIDHGAGAVLVLPADLPLLQVADVESLWRASHQLYAARAMVIAPDSRGSGTNALLLRPPGLLAYQFGPDSFARHCEQAQRLDIAWHVQRSARLGLDVDLPDDLAEYLAVERADGPATAEIETERPGVGVAQADNRRRAMIVDGQMAAFLQKPGLLMRLGTVGRDGYPQVTPVWYLFEDGLFYVTTAADRVKAANMLANPRVGFAIDSEERPYRGLSVWARARLEDQGETARALTRRIAARYVPAESLDGMVDTLMLAPRVVFALEPVRIAPMGSWGEL